MSEAQRVQGNAEGSSRFAYLVKEYSSSQAISIDIVKVSLMHKPESDMQFLRILYLTLLNSDTTGKEAMMALDKLVQAVTEGFQGF